jgi:uncharacterized membrane protein YedE/YeeE
MNITIDWSHFTPWASLFGGILIGLASIMLLAFKGRIAGISGILGSVMQTQNTPPGHYSWRIAFLLGLVLSSAIYGLFFALPISQIDASYLTLVIAGLLVGFGTRMGSGCTSGHAVCGLGRLSVRSLAATLSFMVAGFVTAYIFFHVILGS